MRSVIIFVLQYDYKHGITSNDSYCVVIEQKIVLCLTQYEVIKIREIKEKNQYGITQKYSI